MPSLPLRVPGLEFQFLIQFQPLTLPPAWETWIELQTPGFGLTIADIWGRELVDGRFLSVLSLPLE